MNPPADNRLSARFLLLVAVLWADGCGGGGGSPGDGGASDLSASSMEPIDLAGVDLPCGWCSCAGKPGINGPSDCREQEVGKTFTCSTWEHDYCCACIPLDGRHSWFCFGPHVYSCAPDRHCGADHPIDGRACRPCEVGHRFTCPVPANFGQQLCCDCEATNQGLRWTCRSGTMGTCPPAPAIDAGSCDGM